MPTFTQLAHQLHRQPPLCYDKGMIEMGITAELMPYVLSGRKVIEGRLKIGKFITLRKHDKIRLREDIWQDDRLVSSVPNTATVTVLAVHTYDSFADMLDHEPLAELLPTMRSKKAASEMYGKFYSPAQQAESGVVAIHFKLSR